MPASMVPNKKCVLCGHPTLIRFKPKYRAGGAETPSVEFFDGNTGVPFVTLVCAKCGYCHWFVENPGRLPVEPGAQFRSDDEYRCGICGGMFPAAELKFSGTSGPLCAACSRASCGTCGKEYDLSRLDLEDGAFICPSCQEAKKPSWKRWFG